jgi:hypothetical protein
MYVTGGKARRKEATRRPRLKRVNDIERGPEEKVSDGRFWIDLSHRNQ